QCERHALLGAALYGEIPFRRKASGRLPQSRDGFQHRKSRRDARTGRRLPEDGRQVMRKATALISLTAALLLTSTADAGLFDSNGYPSRGRAIDALKPASDYSDVLKGRPLALGIMRTRGQGFVPSAELHTYARGVMLRLLAGGKPPA